MDVQIIATKQKDVLHLNCEEGISVAGALRRAGLLTMPCGLGKCGKCRIYAETEPTQAEISLLGSAAIEAGVRLACHTKARKGLKITIPEAEEVKVLTTFAADAYEYDPVIKKKALEIDPPTLEDQRSHLQRALDASGMAAHSLTLRQTGQLPSLLYRSSKPYAAIMDDGILCGISSRAHACALVVDIGTTTVACMLADMTAGKIVGVRGEPNRQAAFGADVISRISREMEWRHSSGKEENPLRKSILAQINSMLCSLLSEHGLDDVDCISIVGNTTMIHFLLDLPAEGISRAPFIPVATGPMRMNAESAGIESRAMLFIPPGLSSYIGPDITASLLAAGAHHGQKPFLLADLGTNAETVLHTGESMLACSAAAGPCFEGATLSCGMAGAKGAIDRIYAGEDGRPVLGVIGGCRPRGLCGSGALDAVALLLDAGLVDETGKLEGRAAIGNVDNGIFQLSDDVFVSQKDIREVQLAKAAVRAGMDALLLKAGMEWKDIDSFYIAGGFGSSLNPVSAARIGLIPAELASKTRFLGNAACFGAYRYITEKEGMAATRRMLSGIRYVELSADGDFADAYVERMTFPEVGGQESA